MSNLLLKPSTQLRRPPTAKDIGKESLPLQTMVKGMKADGSRGLHKAKEMTKVTRNWA